MIKLSNTTLVAVLINLLVGGVAFVQADIINFRLQGNTTQGISWENEPPPVENGGSGDIATEITFDDQTRLLSIDIHWGSGNGYTDLSSDVDFMNVHGPTKSSAPASFFENGGVFVELTNFDPSASGGGFTGEVVVPPENVADLMNGKLYLHLHTFVNSGGEARGYMVPEINVDASEFSAFRGLLLSGSLKDTFDSDNNYLKYQPGITLSAVEPPVWLIFDGDLPSDNPTLLTVQIESQVDTVGLSQSIEMFNWNSGEFETVSTSNASFGSDSTMQIELTAQISDYVSPDGVVRSRFGWLQTGPTFLYPWTVCLDEISWFAN